MKRDNLIAYAMAFASYLIQNIESNKTIRSIILFGSIARNDYDKDSDIDVFVDSKDNIENEVKTILDSFYESILYQRYWKLLGITNDISIKVGDLDKWDVKRSIISHGISLYGKYTQDIGGKLYSMFIVDIGGKRSEKLRMWRGLYGYKQKVNKKVYAKKGILEQLDAKRIGPGVIIVPIINANLLKKFLIDNKARYKIIELQSDSL